MRRIFNILLGLVLGALVIVGVSYYNHFQQVRNITKLDLIQDDYYEEYEKKCLDFIENNFLGEEGKIGNDTDKNTVVASEQLLYMTYLLEEGKKEKFEKSVDFLMEQMITPEGMLAIGIEYEMVQSFSSYDQIKLFNLLYKAYDKWGQEEYKNMGKRIEENFYEQYKIEKKIYPYYKIKEDQVLDTQIPLNFLDLNSLGMLANYRKEWIGVYAYSKQLIQNAYISSTFPFYHTIYDYEKKSYNQEHKANMLDTSLIVLSLSQVKLQKQETITWFKNQLKKGVIYEEYDKGTGLPVKYEENVAIYGVIAQIGKVLGDYELYTLAIEKMLSLQIKDKENTFYGGFKTPEEKSINLYENLNALLAF